MRNSVSSQIAKAQGRSLWRNRDFTLLYGGQAVSGLGSNVSGLAFLLLVLALTHSAAQTGLISTMRALPFLVLALPAGAWADRWNRKIVVLLCDSGRALSLASIPLALALGHLTVIQLYANALIEGTLATLFNISATASIPRVVPKHQLTQAAAAISAADQISSFIGPPIGTFLFGVAEAVPFLVDAASYIASVVSLVWIRSDFQQSREAPAGHIFQQIMEGFVWMWKQPVLRFQSVAGTGLNVAFGSIAIIVTLIAQQQHSSDLALGLVFTIGSIGGLLGSVLASRVQKRFSFGQVMMAMFWSMTLLWPLYAIAPNTLVLGMITAGLFFVEPIGSIVNISYRLALTPDAYQGRINSIQRLLGVGVGQSLGVAVAGILLQYKGTTFTVLAFGAVLAIVAIATTLYEPVRSAPRLG